ncbi:type II secretion system protein GspG [Desulfitobacterium dichloroeliminans]|nr:type II secretion system protein GspG [Desulfitobacterium dichloroeliminans]
MEKRSQEGFTLLEMLLILFLIMAVISIAAPRFSSADGVTRTQIDAANRVRIEGAVELYKMDTGVLPQRLEDLYLSPPEVKGWRGPYLDEELVKPTRGGEPYELDERGKITHDD